MNTRNIPKGGIILTIASALLWFSTACEDPDSIGGNLTEPPLSFTITDTLTLDTATILIDSVVTQNSGTILFGGYDDEFLGKVEAGGYMEFSTGPASLTPGSEARYTSLVLRMVPRYHYGDTTRSLPVRVHRLLEPIEPDKNEDLDALYSFNSFEYDSQPIGTYTYRPDRDNILEVQLSDDLGLAIFEAAMNRDDMITDNEDFRDFLKGLVVRGDGTSGTAITGVFPEDPDGEDDLENPGEEPGVSLRLYYNDRGTNGVREDIYYDFPLVLSRSFSSIQSQKPGVLQQLRKANDFVKSSNSNNNLFIQSGIGLMGRIDLDDSAIENLHDLAAYQVLLSAELYLFPVAGTYNTRTPLPEALTLFVADHHNRIIGEFQQSPVILDQEFHQETYYRFDITEFILERLHTEAFTREGLLLSTPSSLYNRSVDRVVLGDGSKSGYNMLLIVIFAELNEL